MKNYLSFGGGVNSVAALFVGSYDGIIFCDTGVEYPETYEYLNLLMKTFSIDVVKPKWGNLYDYSWQHMMVPVTFPRWCTVHFKIEPFSENIEKPAFKNLAFSTDESKRAKISIDNDIEHRFPLLEAEISRDKCKQIIKSAGFPIPHRSKCYICPFQTPREWKALRMDHPDLFCKAERLEQRNIEYRISKGKQPMFLSPKKIPLRAMVNENQSKLWAEDEYPPCECML